MASTGGMQFYFNLAKGTPDLTGRFKKALLNKTSKRRKASRKLHLNSFNFCEGAKKRTVIYLILSDLLLTCAIRLPKYLAVEPLLL